MLTKANPHSEHPEIKAAYRVLETEIRGLQALEEALDERFIKTVALFHSIKGRVIVSGMGKSGHVANKIAATLASTGTPSFFVHPGEASHGDLGMITRDDALLVLSNSGETAELQDMTNYAKRFSIPLVAIVRRASSALVEAADIALVLPEIPEASPVGAPTTSTTMMLALGDAIAVALLEKRGFKPEDFHVFHPGGKLGARFLQVKDLMHSGDKLPTTPPHTNMADVLITMSAKGFGCMAIINEQNQLQGIITDGDLRRCMTTNLLEKAAESVMTPNPVTVKPNMLASEALNIMNSRTITNLFVVNEEKTLVGVIHIHDLLRAGIA